MNDEILVSFRLAISYLKRLVEDLSENQMVCQPRGVQNHPTWVIGHIVHSLQAVGGELGISPWMPSEWSELFGTGSIPQADVAMYPPKEQLIELITDSQYRIVSRLSQMANEDFQKELPDREYRKSLPTVGHALVHILIGHTSVHIGQLTAWRSAMQLPRVSEMFDRNK